MKSKQSKEVDTINISNSRKVLKKYINGTVCKWEDNKWKNCNFWI